MAPLLSTLTQTQENIRAAESARTTATDPFMARLNRRVRHWVRVLHRDPTAEEVASDTRRERLLAELAHAVADAPDDVPISAVIAHLNRADD